MKKLVIVVITFYQHIISPLLVQLVGNQCRYYPTCSAYAKQMVTDKGVMLGGWLALKRILSCQPYSSLFQTNTR